METGDQMETEETKKGPVCVTGATGFIASWLIAKLLHHNYPVHATIRSHHNSHTTFLTNLPGASANLRLFEADLSYPDSFSAAIQGCAAVIHVATPGTSSLDEREEDVVERSISGTLGILKACAESKTVKRVVYTSGASTVVYCSGGREDVETVDESFWSDVEYARMVMSEKSEAARLTRMVSKTVTEKKAIEFAEAHGIDLVTLIPSFVVGPFICSKLPGSVRLALATVLGKKDGSGMLEPPMSVVHVEDVAEAYMFLLKTPDAKGRYICSSHSITRFDQLGSLSIKYPDLTILPVRVCMEKIHRKETIEDGFRSRKDVVGRKEPKISSKKLLDAGFEFKHGIDDMFEGAIQCCIDKGFL